MLIAAAELLAMTLWFSASAVVPQLATEWRLNGGEQAWLTMSVQIGFVIGALASAAFNVADRAPLRLLFALSALFAAVANALIALWQPGVGEAIGLRMLTGIALAGVYPPGMKLAATWSKGDRGLAIGVLVGALTLGSAVPHLLNALPALGGVGGMPPWRSVMLTASALAVAAAIIAGLWVRPGPFLGHSAPFNWRFAGRVFSDRPTRLVNFGYLGHMWELYAMWTWVPVCLIASYERAGWDIASARLAGFGVLASGGLGCVLAGAVADRLGRTTITIASLAVSGACCIVAGFFFEQPGLLTGIAMVWGFTVVADSAQFSAGISELADPRYVGTALTLQTSMGFVLTLLTIRMIPLFLDAMGWRTVFTLLAAGPVIGIWSMWRLRRLPEASRMASGMR